MKDIDENKCQSAEYMKTIIIDYFINQYGIDKILIGNEVMYGTKRKVVDLLIICNNKTIAIEIKAENDDLRRIVEQIEECKKVFDYMIVCTVPVHIEKIKSLTHEIGLYSICGSEVRITRRALKGNCLDKNELLYTMPIKYLKRYLPISQAIDNPDIIRKNSLRIGKEKLHSLFIQFLRSKLEPKFNLFVNDRGEFTHIDDIPILSSYSDIE
ncbi:MAG: hypothetical protein LBM62_02820 [Mediterranea sp.]|jgi:hypothetical protein|nr:hypothetical protein [Mediterranea sp.]